MAYELIWEPEGVHKRFSDVVTARELIQSVEQVQRDPRFDEIHYVIDDFSNIAGHQLSDEVFIELSAINYGAHASNPNCRIAYVSTDPSLVKPIRDILVAGHLPSYQIEVWPSLSEARDWLDSQPKLHLMSNVMGFRSN
jgi:hypothetical protein